MWSQGESGGSPSEAYSIEAMIEAGFDVTHISPGHSRSTEYERRGNLRFIRPSNPFDDFRFLLDTGIAILYRFPAIMRWKNLVLRWLKRSRERFDLIVGHSSETIFALREASRYLGVPALARLYGISATLELLSKGLRRELYFDLISLLRDPPDHIILTNDGTCGDAVAAQFGISPNKYDFLLNGYEPVIPLMPCHERMPNYVLTACRLVDWKRVDRIVKVASLLKERLPGLIFLILGEGPEKPRLCNLIRKEKVESTVKLIGSVSRFKMYEYLRGATMVLFTQDLSNLNNTVIESMVFGKPVITIDAGCTGKIIRHGKTGLMYPADDIESLASGVEKLAKDESLRRNLGQKSMEFALKTFKPWPERIRDEAAIYRRFI